MKALLTSSGITNPSLENALVDLLGKPIAESTALIIPTAIYPFPGGVNYAWRALHNPMTELGWKSLGVLELSVLPSIEQSAWVPTVQETDALLVWGGDPLFLARWMRQSGLADLLPTLESVYVGVSAGSIAAAPSFVESLPAAPRAVDEPLSVEEWNGGYLAAARGLGLTDFAVIPHYEHPDHQDASRANAAEWAARIPHPTYALDDASAVKVVDGEATVVSEGEWHLF